MILSIVQLVVVHHSQRHEEQQRLLGSSHRHQCTVTGTLYQKLSCQSQLHPTSHDPIDKAIQVDFT